VESPLPVERHRLIHEILRDRGVARVSRLAEMLGVSEVTVRRDLEVLERRGMVERTHGGAAHVERMRREPGYLEAAASHPAEKRRIGAAAAGMVEAGDTLFFNGGTTTLEVFRQLRAPGLRIITNHVGMAVESADRDLELLLVGGHYRAQSNSVGGPLATAALRNIHATRAFVGVEALSLRSGLTTPSATEAEVARVMVEQARGEVVVVADRSKIGKVADFVIVPLDSVDVVVTDGPFDDDALEGLAEMGVRVVVADGGVTAAADRPSGEARSAVGS
jgi:DeoR family fructose operon transcriptional repressor